ncbi:recombinase family protein [Actinomadura kijaniata]|uniref:recombinase family protein n=1 Tax=Actinomadura kijaniata TaxID=46161 RepID=UPI000834DC71|nr:recombinase family protein [Actinomadura kijaniata]
MADTHSDLIPVVDYARASADKAKDEHTVKDQQKANESTAKRLGCRIVARFADNDKSAMKEGVIRDDFEEMLRVLRAGRLKDGTPVMGCIVVADDRLIRKTGDYERFVDALTYEDGRVYADKRGFKDLYAEDVETMGLMGAVISRMEIKKMRRRARQWNRARALEGLPKKGHRPFGWQEDRITLDPVESELLRKAVQRVLAGGSVNSIVRDWQKAGVLTPRGNPWKNQTLRLTLRNARLCGWRTINGELVTDDDGDPIVGTWEPVITPSQWQALQAIFDARKGKQITYNGEAVGPIRTDPREHTYLLTSILRCGRILPDGSMCGGKLRAGFEKDRGRHRYFCHTKGSGGCGGLARRGDLVDEFISEAVLAKLEERVQEARPDIGPWPKEKELSDKIEQLKELKSRFAQRRISNSLFFDEVERLEPEIAKLRADRQRHALKAEARTDVTDIRRRWYSEIDEDRLDISQKRTYIREALHAVIVHPAGQGRGNKFDPNLLEPVWRED